MCQHKIQPLGSLRSLRLSGVKIKVVSTVYGLIALPVEVEGLQPLAEALVLHLALQLVRVHLHKIEEYQ